ncbi:MAG: hypothetical protein MUF55_01440 [Hydrogenophaga sp.]|nr:hypothetical protein [Hydrogenophaga sp.]
MVQSVGATSLDSCDDGFVSTRYTTNLTVNAGTGVVVVDGTVDTLAIRVTLTPVINGNNIERWTCTGDPIRLMPGSCRGT